MSRILTYRWPASNITDVCQLQNSVNNTLILNGNLANSIKTAVPFINYGYVRSVNIFSPDNLAARTFHVQGYQNGCFINESVTGPNNSTVSTTNSFDTVTAITTDGAVTNVKVGSGYIGFFPLIALNIERDVINYSLSVAKLTAASIEISLYQAFSNIAGNNHSFLDIVTNDHNVPSIETVTQDTYILEYSTLEATLCRAFLIKINGDNTTANNSLQLNFIQT